MSEIPVHEVVVKVSTVNAVKICKGLFTKRSDIIIGIVKKVDMYAYTITVTRLGKDFAFERFDQILTSDYRFSNPIQAKEAGSFFVDEVIGLERTVDGAE
jgi:hypothetical protein